MNHGIVRSLARGAVVATMAVGIGLIGANADVSAQDADAQVRIVHASPDAPNVDVWVNGEPAVTDLAFGEATDLIPLPAGSYDVAVTAAGDPIENAVITATLDLAAGAAYEVAAVGFLDEISAQVYPIDISALAEGDARIRFIHNSPDAPPVDINIAGGPSVKNLTFPNATDFITVPAGTYDVSVAVAETDEEVLNVPGVAVEAGTVYDVFAIGEAGAGTLTVLPLTAPATASTGGEAAAAAPADATSGATAAPATGVGSMAGDSSNYLFVLLAAAVFFVATGAYRASAPARKRTK